MIDKNGKLFGKINIIDLIVIIALVAAVAVFGYSKMSQKNSVGTVATPTVTMEFYTDEVADYVVEHVKEGTPIYDADEDIKLGTVKSFEVGPSKVYTENSEGAVVVSEKEGYSSIRIVGEINGSYQEYGAEVEGVKYGVGHTVTIRAGQAKIHLKVSDIK